MSLISCHDGFGAMQIVPNMHMGVDTSSVPSLQVPTGRRTGATKGLNRRVPEEMTDRTNTSLMQFRIQLVKQVRLSSFCFDHVAGLLYLMPSLREQYIASQPQLLEQVQELTVSPYPMRLELFEIARKGFSTRLKVKTAGNMQLVSASDLVDIKAELFNDYCASFLKFLSPGLLRLQAVTLTSQLARCLMGSAGGTGCDWGLSRLQAFDDTENPDPAKVCAPTALGVACRRKRSSQFMF